MATELDPFESFTGTWGGTVSFTWEPDPHVVAAQIMRVADALEDMTKPMLAAQAISRADMHVRFDTDSDPDGNAWQPLDPDYARKKELLGGDPNDVLTFSGAGEDAATSAEAFPISGHELFFSTGTLPEYMMYHQHGTGEEGSVGARRSLFESSVASGDPGRSHESLGIGRGNALPARPFIGVSEKAQIQIIEAFDLWFDEAVSIHIGKSGVMQRRLPSGRFGAKI